MMSATEKVAVDVIAASEGSVKRRCCLVVLPRSWQGGGVA
jgi:hypothetical protein